MFIKYLRQRAIQRATTVMLILIGGTAHASDIAGEVLISSVVSKNKSEQQSLTEVSVYLEYALGEADSAFLVGYHDQEFRSVTLGWARKYGGLQLGLGIGQATFDGLNHVVLNPWAYFADDDHKGYLHYEQYRNGSTHSQFMKGYVLKNSDAISLGVHAETDFGLGPRAEVKLADGLSLWGVLPIAHPPTEGAMKGMIGLTVEF